MTSLAASAWVEIPADCPISGKIDTDGLHFAIGSTAAGDLAFDVVFEPGALRRFVDLANGMLAECELAPRIGTARHDHTVGIPRGDHRRGVRHPGDDQVRGPPEHAAMTVDTAAGVNELDVLLTEVGRRGFLLHAFRVDLHGPEIVAFVHAWGGCADVLILFDERRGSAHRVPTGPGIDVFAPTRVIWWYASRPVWTVRALLTLAPPGHPDAPTTLTDAPPDYGLPASGRMPVRVRARGWH